MTQIFINRIGRMIDFSSSKVIHGFKTAFACLIGYMLVLTTPLPEAQWVVITILVVMSAQPSMGSLFIKAKMRFWGTVCGTLAGAVTVLLCHNDPAKLAIALFIFTLIFSYVASNPGDISYVGTLGAVTLVIIILAPHANLSIAGERFIEIVLGIILSFLVSQFVFPIRSHTIFLKNLGSTLAYLHEYFEGCFQKNPPDINDHLLDMNEQMLVIFSRQRRLILETGLELGKSRKDKIIFQEILNAERRVYRAINLMYHSFHAAPESMQIIESLSGFERFKRDVSQFLLQLSIAVKKMSIREIDFLLEELVDILEDDFKKILLTQEFQHIAGVYTFLFGVKFLMSGLKNLTLSLGKIKFQSN
jgi:Fusaric acid resistance protein family